MTDRPQKTYKLNMMIITISFHGCQVTLVNYQSFAIKWHFYSVLVVPKTPATLCYNVYSLSSAHV